MFVWSPAGARQSRLKCVAVASPCRECVTGVSRMRRKGVASAPRLRQEIVASALRACHERAASVSRVRCERVTRVPRACRECVTSVSRVTLRQRDASVSTSDSPPKFHSSSCVACSSVRRGAHACPLLANALSLALEAFAEAVRCMRHDRPGDRTKLAPRRRSRPIGFRPSAASTHVSLASDTPRRSSAPQVQLVSIAKPTRALARRCVGLRCVRCPLNVSHGATDRSTAHVDASVSLALLRSTLRLMVMESVPLAGRCRRIRTTLASSVEVVFPFASGI